jgi:amino acid adenylation domain-containing protein
MREKAIAVAETFPWPNAGTPPTEQPERLELGSLVALWCGPFVNHPRNLGLHELVEAQAERTPVNEAVRFRNESLTYWELNARANQLAHYLRKHGVGRDVLVAVCAERSFEMVIALLATLKAGGAYLPLDPEFPAERLRAILEDANPPVVLAQSHLLDRVPASRADCLCLDSNWEKVAGEPASNLGVEVGGKDLAYAIYTSGSTGKPKGVLNVHQGIVNRLLWMQDEFPLEQSDRVLQKTPYSFDISVWEFFWPLLNGALLVISEPGGHRDADYLIRIISQQQISIAHFVPSMLRVFLEAPGVEQCVSLRKVFASGEALTYDIQQRFFERLQVPLLNLYGPTEAAVDVTFFACQRNSTSKIIPIGRPIANTCIVILDENRQPVPIGVAGELNIGGVNLARGYLNQPELTAEKFLPNSIPELDTDRLYRTGDLARFMPDGNVEYLGRIDHQVKIRGYRIELGEIEAALKDQSEIANAVVVAREDRPGDQRLAAYLVASNCKRPESAELRRRLKLRLPDYMVPSSYTFLEELPLTRNGKFDRNALPAPTEASTVQPENSDPPRNPVEETLASIWTEVLDLPRVGIHDNFFDLGGHSLLAARLLGKIEKAFSIKLNLSSLFNAPTLVQLAAFISNGDAPAHHVVVPIQPAGLRPPFLCLDAGPMYLKLARLLGPEQPFLGVPGPDPALLRDPVTLEDFTALQVEAIRKIQPSGPYCLGGWSASAVAAYEAARQLRAQGEKVALLVLFDGDNPAAHGSNDSVERLKDHILRIAERVRYHASKLVAGGVRNILPYVRDRLKWQTYIFSVRAWSFVYWIHQRLGRAIPSWMRASDKILIHCSYRYRPAPYAGRTLLFRHASRPKRTAEDSLLGWGGLCVGRFEVCDVPGNHREIFVEPNVRVMAEKLSEALQEVYQESCQEI